MNFSETIETIGKWVDSCNTPKQLNLCLDAIDFFIINRYKNHVPKEKMDIAIGDLYGKVDSKRRKIYYE